MFQNFFKDGLVNRLVAVVIIVSFILSSGPVNIYASIFTFDHIRPQATKDSNVEEQITKELETSKGKIIVKRIGVLTGGGPASGHNAVIAAMVKEARKLGIEIVPIYQGWKGLVDDKLVAQSQNRVLNPDEVEKVKNKGGTILVTSRTNPYSDEDRKKGTPQKLWENTQKLKLDALVTLGGDDTNSVSYWLQTDHPDYLIIGLPKTMDNDIKLTENDAVTYGYYSFTEKATPAVSDGKVDAQSTRRVLVVEVFGRSAGFVVVRIGANVEATRTLIPEEELDLEKLVNDVARYHKEHGYAVVIVSEGIKINYEYKNNPKFLQAAFKADEMAKVAFWNGFKPGKKDEFGHPKLENTGLIISAVLKAALKEKKIEISHAGKVDYLFRSADAAAEDLRMCTMLGEQVVKELVENNHNRLLYVYGDAVKSMPLTKELGGRKLDYQGADKADYLKANQAILQQDGGAVVVSNQPQVNFANTDKVNEALKGIVEVTDKAVKVTNEALLRERLIDQLVYDATFNPNQDIAKLCRKLIRDIAASQGARLGSVYDLYVRKAKDSRQYTVPAINVRGMAYNTAQAIFESAVANKVGAVILEIAKSEIGYSGQRPAEYTTSILAAAIKVGYKQPVFIQGDHFQINAKDFQADPIKALEDVKKLIREAIEAGFYQVDLDMSVLVDWSKSTFAEQQELNYRETALLTAYVRDLERELGLDKLGIVVNLGGEIGEIGKGLEAGKERNSSIDDLNAFWTGYTNMLNTLSKEKGYKILPITKIAIQTGTKHGGIRGQDGKVVTAKVSFNTIAELGELARTLGFAGVVQHGASTLDPRCFTVFAGKEVPEGFEIAPELLSAQNKAMLKQNPTAEVHLATAYQDTIMDHPQVPESLSKEVRAYILEKFPVKTGQQEQGAFVENRKNAWGPFKVQYWNLPGNIQEAIRKSLGAQFDTVFTNLGVKDSIVSELMWGKKLAPIVEAFSSDINYRVSDKVVQLNSAEKGKVYPILINHDSLLKNSPDGIMALQNIFAQLGKGNVQFVLHIARGDVKPEEADKIIEETFDTINKINEGYTKINRDMFIAIVVGTNPEDIAKQVKEKVGVGIYQVIGPQDYAGQFKDVIRIALDEANKEQLTLMAKALKLGLEIIPVEGKVSNDELKKLDALFSVDGKGDFHVQPANILATVEMALKQYAKQVEAEIRV